MVGRAIESALVHNAEIVVVDDGSTDGSWDVISAYPVKAIRTENRGVSAARNTGIEAATGDYIRFLDSDDRILSALTPLPGEQIPVGEVANRNYGFPNIEGPIPGTALMGGTLSCWLALFPREALADGFDERLRLSEDYELAARLHSQGWQFVRVPGLVYDLNDHTGDRLSRDYSRDYYRAQLLAFETVASQITHQELLSAQRYAWIMGRDASRLRFREEADALFAFAGSARVGPLPLRLLYKVLHPFTAELVLEKVKAIRRPQL